MATSPYVNTSSTAWNSSVGDPVPGILARRLPARLGIFGCAAAGGTAVWALAAAFDFPNGWLYIAVAACLTFIQVGSMYVRSMSREPFVDSILDLLIQVAWSAVKLVLLFNAIWAGYDMFFAEASPGEAVSGFVRRLIGLRDISLRQTLESPTINLMQLALLIPLWTPVRRTATELLRARGFEKQISIGTDRRVSKSIEKARRLIGRGEMEEAHRHLEEAAEQMGKLHGGKVAPAIRQHRARRAREILRLRESTGARTSAHSTPIVDELHSADPLDQTTASGSAPATAPEESKADAGYGKYQEFFDSLRERSSITWRDIAGLTEVVSELKTSFAMALAAAPKGVKLEAPRTMLLYGPPGTGKTLLSAAVSNSFDAPFFNVRVSDVLSKYFGESSRLLQSLFELGEEIAPAVLFFDEIESISADRDGGGMDGEEMRMISALLSAMDGLKSKGTSTPLFTIAATNVPWKIDSAILSRFEKRFFIPLPDKVARARMFELQIDERGLQSQVPLEQLVRFSRGYSGREISQLCNEGVRLMTAEANPDIEAMVDRGREALAKYRMKARPISVANWNAAYRKVRPRTDPALIERYRQWADSA